MKKRKREREFSTHCLFLYFIFRSFYLKGQRLQARISLWYWLYKLSWQKVKASPVCICVSSCQCSRGERQMAQCMWMWMCDKFKVTNTWRVFYFILWTTKNELHINLVLPHIWKVFILPFFPWLELQFNLHPENEKSKYQLFLPFALFTRPAKRFWSRGPRVKQHKWTHK